MRARHRGAASAWPPPPSFFAQPRGYVDTPGDEDEVPRGPLQLLGWCLIPGTTVARVEVSVAGAPPRRARVAIERLDVREACAHPDAAVSGFEYKIDLAQLPPSTAEVTVEAVAHAVDGRRFELPPLTLRVAADQPRFADDGRAAELRARSTRHASRLAPRERSAATRILAFTHRLDYSGGSLYLLEVLRRLVAAPGTECEVVSLADGPLRHDFEDAGMPVHVTDGFPVATVERYEGNQAELMAWIALRGFDVALVNTIGCFSGADVAMRLGIPVVWAVHESFPLNEYWLTAYPPGTPHPYVRRRAEESLRDADAVVFEAEATRQLYVPHADPQRLITLPYGIELAEVDAARLARDRAQVRRRLGFAEGTRVVLCLGTIEARKSQSLLVEAFAELADRHPRAQLVLVGESGADYCADYAAALREYVRRRGLESRVRIEPITSDPYSWHLAADLLACSSDVESLPRVLLEAMAFGTPVVSTRVFGVPELIDDGHTGYLCETRDVTALAAALDRALGADAVQLEAVSAAASQRVRTQHDPARYAQRLERLLRKVAGARETRTATTEPLAS